MLGRYLENPSWEQAVGPALAELALFESAIRVEGGVQIGGDFRGGRIGTSGGP